MTRKENNMGRVNGKIALVTGGASGIGQATSEVLAREGATVIISDIQEAEGNQVVANIIKEGGKASFKSHDVADESHWQSIISEIAEEFGGLDILVNNAGIGIPSLITEMSLESWRRQRSINLDGVFLGVKHAIPVMAESGGGSIVNISSVAGLQGAAGMSGYNATKGGVRIFTKGVAKECAMGGLNIRVNSVHPGIIATPIWALKELTGEQRKNINFPGSEGANAVDVDAMAEAQVPLGVAGTAEDIAKGILFLASDDSSHMTGSELVIDGGITA
jgi:NAD(P)-dependent dehydrogenase (short-subunit alcohol dehydrogenase family)